MTAKVAGRTLTLSVDVPDDVRYPVLVDPIIEDQFPQPGNGTDPNAGFTNTRGWRRDSSLGLGAFAFLPNVDNPPGNGTECLRIRNDSTIERIDHTMCVGTVSSVNYPISSTFQSIGAWTWRPPAGTRSSQNDNPPNTDAFVFRANVRNGYVDNVKPGGNTVMVAGLISGRTHTWAGHHAVFLTDTSPVLGGTGPFIIDFSQSSYYGTYCLASDCTAELDDPAYDGTYMAWGVWAAGTGQQASAVGQGAQLYQSDRLAPILAHLPISDATRWYRNGQFTSRATATDTGMGMKRLGILFAGQVTPSQTVLGCTGLTDGACPGSIPLQNFVANVDEMPEGRNDVFAVGTDILGRSTNMAMTGDGTPNTPVVKVKVDRTAPTINPLTGTLADRNGRAVKDGTYQLSAVAVDGADRSGVRSITFKRADNSVIQSFPMTCSGNDCPATSPTATISVNTATLPVGPYTIKVVAEDSAGNVVPDATGPAVRFVVDHAPPTITSVAHTPPLTGWLGARTLTTQATATDDASGVKRFTLTTPTSGGSTTSADTVVSGCDDTIANLCSSPVTRSLTYATSAMGDGPARPVSLTASDALGQTSSPARQWSVDVDTAGPALTLSGPAWNARDGYVGSGSRALQVAAVDSVGGQQRSGVARITMRIDHPPPDEPIADSVSQTCTTTGSQRCDLSGTLTIPAGLGGGEHTVYVTASDNADPANTTTTSFKLYVDEEPPEITNVVHDPAPPDAWRDDVPRTATVRAHDDLSGVASIAMALEPNPAGTVGPPMPTIGPFLVPCSGPPASPCPKDATGTFSYATDALVEGERTATATARDQAGNTSTEASWKLKLDRTPPTAVYSGSLTQLSGQTLVGGSTSLRVDAADARSGVKRIRFLVDGQEKLRKEGDCTAAGCPATLSETFAIASYDYPAGTHTVVAETTDLVGTPAVRHVITQQYTFINLPLAAPAEGSGNVLGFEDWVSYDDHATGAGSGVSVNVANGNALWSHQFLSNEGRGIDSIGTVTYNSQEPGLLEGLGLPGIPPLGGLLTPLSSEYIQAGRGVSLNLSGITRLNQALQFVGGTILNPPTEIRLTDGDGTRHSFPRQSDGSFRGPAGTFLRLRPFDTSATSARHWAMTRPDGTTYFFDRQGYLRAINDRVGNVMEYRYQEGSYAQCGNPLPLVGNLACVRRVTQIVDATGLSDGAPNRSVVIAYVGGNDSKTGLIDSIADHGARVTKFGYDTQKRLVSLTEANGTPVARTFTLGYQGSSSPYLTSVVDPRGADSRIAYEPQGLFATSPRRMTGFADRQDRGYSYAYAQTVLDGATVANTAITDPKGRVTQVRTDARQRRVEVLDARNKRDRWFWDDAVNKPSRHIEAQGTSDEAITKWQWGSLGQLNKAFAPFKAADEANARATTFDYHVFSGSYAPGDPVATPIVYDKTKMTPPKGAAFATTWQVDDQGRVMKECLPDTPCSVFTYGSAGLLIKEVDPQGSATEYLDHDPSGLPRRTLDPRNKIWQRRYDNVGNVLAVRDPRGAPAASPLDDLPARTPFTARFTYDALDRKRVEVIPKQSVDGRYIQRSFDYDANDNPTTVTDGVGAVWRTTFTDTDQVKSELSPAVAHHDNLAPESEETRYDYDATDNVAAIHRPESRGGAGFETRYAYDAVDQRVVQRQVSTEPEPASGIHELVQSWAFDLRGNTVGVADPNTNLEVDDATAAANAADPVKQRVASTYDAADRATARIEDPVGLKLTTTFTYDDNDNLATEVSPRGNELGANPAQFTTRYEYDRRDLKTAEIDPLGRRTQWDLRNDGRVAGVTTPRGTETPTAGDFTTTFEYDATGDLKSETLPRRPGQYGPATLKITYTRNDVGDPRTIKDARGHSFTNEFLDTGELRSTTRPSWWVWDEAQGVARERDEEDGPPADAARAIPASSGAGDFGVVDAQNMPNVLPRAGRTELFYDDELRLSSVRDVAGNAQTFMHDQAGRMTRREIPFKDGEAPALCAPGVKSAEPTSGPIATRWSYDRNGNVRTMLDGRCQETTWGYDQFDRLTRSSRPAGWDGTRGVSEQKYDRNGNTATRSNPRSVDAIERMTYDDVDRLLSRVEPFSAGEGSPRSEWRYRYDANGNQIREIRPRSLEPGADPANFTTVLEYDRADQLTRATNGAGRATEYGYDADGNQTDVTAPGAARSDSTVVLPRVSHTEYEGRGLPWVQSVGSGDDRRTTITEYDGNGNLRRSVTPKGVTSLDRPRYDDIAEAASMTTMSTASWNATVSEYDADDLMTATYLPWDETDNGTRYKQRHTYNARGWPEAVSGVFKWTGSNSPDFETRYDYLRTGWVNTSIDKPLDGGQATQTLKYNYDLGGNQTLWASPGDTRRVERTFFPNGELEQRRAIRTTVGGPAGGDRETRTYDYERNRAGELIALVDRDPPRPSTGPTPLQRTTSITRDVAGRARKVNESWDGGRDTVYHYAVGGLLGDVSVDGTIQTDGSYSGGRTMTYGYDILDRVDDVAVKEADADSARHTRFTYWPSNEQRTVTKTNQAVEERFYLTDGLLAKRTVAPGQSGSAAQSHSYSYDVNANRTTDERGGYDYNARDQLTRWTPADPLPGAPTAVRYAPGGDGSIDVKTETFSGGVTRRTTNDYSGEQLSTSEIRTTGAGGDGNDDLKFGYDNFGSLLTIKKAPAGSSNYETSTQYTYDPFERLLSSRDDTDDDGAADGPHTVYCYDALDRRDRKVTGVPDVDDPSAPGGSFAKQREACRNPSSGEQTLDYSYLGLGEQLTRELTPTKGTRTYDYTPDGTRLGVRLKTSPSAEQAFHPYDFDAQGSVYAVESAAPSSGSGDRYRYDPYGETLNEASLGTVGKDNPFRYQAFYRDAESGTYDMYARAYRPSIGRFLSQDRFEDPTADLTLQQNPLTNNRYAFLAGNPTNGLELDGHMCWSPKCAAETLQKGADWVNDHVVKPARKFVNKQRRRVERAITKTAQKARQVATATVRVVAQAATAVAGVAVEVAAPALDYTQVALGVVGFVPGLGEVADLANAGISLARGDLVGAGLSLGAAIPFAGWVAGGANVARTGAHAVGSVSRLASGAARGGRAASRGIRATASRAKRSLKPCNSFSAGTLVLMADGSQEPISDVRVGDWVLATNPETGETRARRVTDVIVGTGPKQLKRVVVAGTQIVATDGHPFYVADEHVWTDAADLRQGDELLAADGRRVAVSAVIDADQTATVYNLTVDADHTYYAGDRPVLVHNAKACDVSGATKARLPRFNGPKPTYDVNPAHVPGRGLRPGKTPLPADAEEVYRRAVPNDPTNPTAWFATNSTGQAYRYSVDNVGGAHFSGIGGVGDGVRNLTKYARGRLGGE